MIFHHDAYGAAGTAVSGTTTYLSDATTIQVERDVSYVVDVTGTPTGTLTVQVSNSSDSQIRLAADKWVTYTGITLPAIAGAATSFGIELVALPFRRVRLKYVNAASTGTIFAELTTKAI